MRRRRGLCSNVHDPLTNGIGASRSQRGHRRKTPPDTHQESTRAAVPVTFAPDVFLPDQVSARSFRPPLAPPDRGSVPGFWRRAARRTPHARLSHDSQRYAQASAASDCYAPQGNTGLVSPRIHFCGISENSHRGIRYALWESVESPYALLLAHRFPERNGFMRLSPRPSTERLKALRARCPKRASLQKRPVPTEGPTPW